MGTVVQLFVDVAQVALGLTPFSMVAWTYVTVLLLATGPAFAHVAPRVIDPPARMLAVDPVRIVRWMPLSVLTMFAATLALFITVIGALLVPMLAIALVLVGFLAVSRLVGELLLVRLGVAAPGAALASAVGIVALRVVRLVPYLGAPVQSLIGWAGFAAAAACAVRGAWSWHKRRLPDVVQFRGETLVEWYPDGDPADGRPSIGTGRPVLENVRGDEDRQPRPDDSH